MIMYKATKLQMKEKEKLQQESTHLTPAPKPKPKPQPIIINEPQPLLIPFRSPRPSPRPSPWASPETSPRPSPRPSPWASPVHSPNPSPRSSPPRTPNIPKGLFKIMEQYFAEQKTFYLDLNGRKCEVTEAMLKEIPMLEKRKLGEETTSSENITDLSDILLDSQGRTTKETIAITGSAGSGKSTLASIFEKFYVNHNNWVFPLHVSDLANQDDGIIISFVDFIRTFSRMDIPTGGGFTDDDVDQLLRHHERRCVFVMHGVHRSGLEPPPFGRCEPFRRRMTTSASWFRFLLDKKKMAESKLIYTTREGAFLPIVTSSPPPDVIYRLRGLRESGVKSLVTSRGLDADDVMKSIERRGSSFADLVTCPLILDAMTSLSSKKLTLTRLYDVIMGKLRDSPHFGVGSGEIVKNFRFLCFDLLRNDENSVRCDQLVGLSLADLEAVAMVTVECRKRHRIQDEDVNIKLVYQSLQEYHAAEYFIHEMDIKEFEKNINNFLFSLDDSRWVMVRRFVAGKLHLNQEKKKKFLSAYIKQLSSMMTTTFMGELSATEKSKFETFQAHLFMDLQEMNDEVDSIIDQMPTSDNLSVEVEMKEMIQLQGLNYFLQNFDPHMKLFHLTLPTKHGDINSLLTSIKGLTCKIEWCFIKKVKFTSSHVRQIEQLLSKVVKCLYMQISDDVSSDNFLHLKSNVEKLMGNTKSFTSSIRLNHQGRDYLLRHKPTKMTRLSTINKKYISVDLRLPLDINELMVDVNDDIWFEFTICERHEMINLCKLLKYRSLNIGIMIVYLPDDLDNDLMKQFSDALSLNDQEIKYVHMMNIYNARQFDEICKLMTNIRHLRINIINDLTKEQKNKALSKLPTQLPESLKIQFIDSEFCVGCGDVRVKEEVKEITELQQQLQPAIEQQQPKPAVEVIITPTNTQQEESPTQQSTVGQQISEKLINLSFRRRVSTALGDRPTASRSRRASQNLSDLPNLRRTTSVSRLVSQFATGKNPNSPEKPKPAAFRRRVSHCLGEKPNLQRPSSNLNRVSQRLSEKPTLSLSRRISH